MLVSNNFNIVSQINLELEFDDGTSKSVKLEEGQMVTVTFNKKNVKEYITGKITKIGLQIREPGIISYFIVDGSSEYLHKQIRLRPSDVLDIYVYEIDPNIEMSIYDAVDQYLDNHGIVPITESQLLEILK